MTHPSRTLQIDRKCCSNGIFLPCRISINPNEQMIVAIQYTHTNATMHNTPHAHRTAFIHRSRYYQLLWQQNVNKTHGGLVTVTVFRMLFSYRMHNALSIVECNTNFVRQHLLLHFHTQNNITTDS